MKNNLETIEVVAAIIKNGNKILSTQRGHGEFSGGWEFPGGKIENGETKEEALEREINEELSLDININELIYTLEYDYQTFHLTMYCFICSIESGELTLNEHLAYKWLAKEELNTVGWLAADVELIEYLKKNWNNLI